MPQLSSSVEGFLVALQSNYRNHTATRPCHSHHPRKQTRSLQLLLRAQLVRVPALLLPAIGRPRRQARVALPADHLVAVVLGGQRLERGLDDAAAEAEDQVEGGLLQIS